MKKIRVGVLMGGKSIEHEVSFNSGRTVCDHLDAMHYEIVPIYQSKAGDLYILPWHFLHRGKTADFVHRLTNEAQKIVWDDLKNYIDFIFLTVHGRYAEDGTIQGVLEVLGIPYLGSDVFASALSFDKVIQKNMLKAAGIAVPAGIVITPHEIDRYKEQPILLQQRLAQAGLHVPVIIKPRAEGSSLGVRVVTDEADLYDALVYASTIFAEKRQDVLIEERLQGMEFSCMIIEDYITGTLIPLPPTEIAQEDDNLFFDYEQKYMPGCAHEYTPPRCSKELIKSIQDVCVRATQLLGVKTVSRIDGYATSDNRIVIFDSNTLSGMGPASLLFRAAAEAGMSHTVLINHLIKTDLHHYGLLTQKHKEKKQDKQMHTDKIRVAVLLGGHSSEREISLESGRNVVYKLSPQRYKAIPIFVSSTMEFYQITQSLLVRNATKEIEALLEPSMKIQWANLPTIADFVFIGLHGGLGENGAVQGALEMLGMPYNGSSVLASALCMDKYRSAHYLKQHEIAVPESILVSKTMWLKDKNVVLEKIHQQIPLPRIVKPHNDGCSVMVQKIKSEEGMISAIEHVLSKKDHVLIEECITGMELTVGVLGNDCPKALPPSQAVVAADILSIEEKFLPGAGENQTPAPLPAVTLAYIQEIIETTYKIVGCKGYARIDCFYQDEHQSPTGKERVVILEINTLPGLTPATCLFHQAAEVGIKPMELIDMIITFGLQEHAYAAQQRGISATHLTIAEELERCYGSEENR